MTRASTILLVAIVLSLIGVLSYGGYHYVSDHPSILNFLHTGSSPATRSSVSTQSEFTTPSRASLITFATQVNSTTSSGATVYFAVTSSSVTLPTVSTVSSSTSENNTFTESQNTITSLQSTNSSVALSSNSSQLWIFVLAGPATIDVTGGTTHLNVTFTNTQQTSASVYVSGSLSSATQTTHVGSPPLLVAGGGNVNFYLDLGKLGSGHYSVSFYVVGNPSNAQLSALNTIAFQV